MQLKPLLQRDIDNIKANLGRILTSELGLGIEELDFKKALESYGLDSLRVAKIIDKVNTDFKINLTFEAFEKCDTVDSLVIYISQRLEHKNRLNSEPILGGKKASGIAQVIIPASAAARKKSLNNVQNTSIIAGISSHFPSSYFKQEELTSIFLDGLSSENIGIDPEEVERFFTNVTLEGRHFALSPFNNLGDEEALSKGIEAAVDLAEKAIDNLLKSKDLKEEDISMVVETSLLPATPSIFARVMSRSSFPSDTKRMSLYGVGCMNGVHGLSRVDDYLQGHPTEAVILVSVELSSVLWQGSFQHDLQQYLAKHSEFPEQCNSAIKMTLVTAALFGDGAVALLIVGSEHPLYSKSQGASQPQIIDTRINLVPNTSELIGVDILLNNSSFRAIVRPEVPELLPDAIAQTIEPLLKKNNLALQDISHWILHPGGPKIMRAIEAEFELSASALSLSWSTLSSKGNLSSAHVLYMLEQLYCSCDRVPKKGEFGLMIAMGPGLSQEAILLKF